MQLTQERERGRVALNIRESEGGLLWLFLLSVGHVGSAIFARVAAGEQFLAAAADCVSQEAVECFGKMQLLLVWDDRGQARLAIRYEGSARPVFLWRGTLRLLGHRHWIWSRFSMNSESDSDFDPCQPDSD